MKDDVQETHNENKSSLAMLDFKIYNLEECKMATIGQALTAPEVGWRRFDNADSNITYDSSSEWSKYTNQNGDYLNTVTLT